MNETLAAFCEAALRHNKLLIDNVGITINETELPSWELFKYCRQKVYGTHWLSRFWCRHIRPFVAPKKQMDLLIDFAAAELQWRTDFMNAILERGSK